MLNSLCSKYPNFKIMLENLSKTEALKNLFSGHVKIEDFYGYKTVSFVNIETVEIFDFDAANQRFACFSFNSAKLKFC